MAGPAWLDQAEVEEEMKVEFKVMTSWLVPVVLIAACASLSWLAFQLDMTGLLRLIVCGTALGFALIGIDNWLWWRQRR